MDQLAMIARYFAPPQSFKTQWKMVGVGAFFFVAFLSEATVLGLIGLAVAVWGGYQIYVAKKAPTSSDAEVQQAIAQGAATAVQEAYERFGILPEQLIGPPVVLTGPDFDSPAKQAADGDWITAINHVNVLLFTDRTLHIYSLTFDVTDPAARSTTTEEYYYRHIVSVTTSESQFVVGEGDARRVVHEDTFELRSTSGQPRRLTAYNSAELRQAVASARTMINERQD